MKTVKSTNPFDDDADVDLTDLAASTAKEDDDDDDDDDEAALAKLLDEMDIDGDYNAWTSFRASVSIQSRSRSSGGAGRGASSGGTSSAGGGLATSSIKEEEGNHDYDDALTEAEQSYIAKWSPRYSPHRKDEIYSKHYRPVPRETREVQALATFLGLNGGGGKCKSSAASRLLFPAADEPKSILLKRGPVLLSISIGSAKGKGGGQGAAEERELILLSRGFIIATPLALDEATDSEAEAATGINTSSQEGNKDLMGNPTALLKKIPSGFAKLPSGLAKLPSASRHLLGNKKVIHRHFQSAEMLSSVVAIEDNGAGNNSFAILVNNTKDGGCGGGGGGGTKPTRLQFTCAKSGQRKAWVDALTRVLEGAERAASLDEEADKLANELDLCGGAAAADGVHDNSRGASSHNDRAQAATGVLSHNMAALRERGDKLERLERKTGYLEQNAADYRNTARQLKEKAKNQNGFGF